MGRTLLLLYSAACYLAFFATFVYAIGFVGCVGVPKCVDTGAATSLTQALLVDTALLGAFAVQHSIMARRWFKRWWTKIIPPAAERSTYVLAATLLLALLLWQWRPIPEVVWNVREHAARTAFYGLYFLGWLVLLAGTFMIDHFDLFGLRQAWIRFRNREYTHPPFTTAGFYRYTRNPLMLGFIIAFWAAPTMTVGRLFFAAMSTAYILVGIALEERDHAFYLGARYKAYKERTSMLIPLPPRSAPQRHAPAGEGAE
ncbi:MAG: isoprenylcysteine carboxylmethyltransferase family protein [Gemmatimonadota bacterium]|jgi:protein-S-isoprenylcysteine O-methyltransferase Ste14